MFYDISSERSEDTFMNMATGLKHNAMHALKISTNDFATPIQHTLGLIKYKLSGILLKISWQWKLKMD